MMTTGSSIRHARTTPKNAVLRVFEASSSFWIAIVEYLAHADSSESASIMTYDVMVVASGMIPYVAIPSSSR